MKDHLGKILEVGDTVVFPLSNHSEIGVGKILKMSEKTVGVDVSKYNTKEGWGHGVNNILTRHPKQVVKIVGGE